MREGASVVRTSSLCMSYGNARRMETPRWIVDSVDLEVFPGEIVGLVGGSGSGKSSLARCIAGLQRFNQGFIEYESDLKVMPGGKQKVPRIRGVQMAFQDPTQSLNPRRSVGSVLNEILAVHALCARDQRSTRVAELLNQVGLDARVAKLRPAQMSGGMCQRVALARALSLEPGLLIADEVVSALDASVQAQVLNLLLDLRDETGIAVLFITHDVAVVRQICDRVIVLQSGRIVEQGTVEEVLSHPEHAYTRELMSAANSIDPGNPLGEPCL
jgi:peptide/nickel transport system ATP-binding protein